MPGAGPSTPTRQHPGCRRPEAQSALANVASGTYGLGRLALRLAFVACQGLVTTPPRVGTMSAFALNAKLIPPDHRVWLVYSGTRRRYLPHFHAENCVFLETPGFQPTTDLFSVDNLLRQHLRLSRAIHDYQRGRTENAPDRTPLRYSDAPGDPTKPEGRKFNAYVGNVVTLFCRVKPGDLVISPPVGHYAPMLIGEVVSEWARDQVINIPELNDEPVPVRQVRWLRRGLSRRDFPPNIARLMQNRHAISEFPRDLCAGIYFRVYGAYIWTNTAKVDFLASKYSSHDPLETYDAALLIKYFLAALNAQKIGQLEAFNGLSFFEAANCFYEPALVHEFTQNFNSPGVFTLITAGLAAAVVAVGVAIATDTESLNTILHDFAVIEGYGDTRAHNAQHPVHDQVKNLIDGLGRDRLEELRTRVGQPAREQLGLTTAVERQDLE